MKIVCHPDDVDDVVRVLNVTPNDERLVLDAKQSRGVGTLSLPNAARKFDTNTGAWKEG